MARNAAKADWIRSQQIVSRLKAMAARGAANVGRMQGQVQDKVRRVEQDQKMAQQAAIEKRRKDLRQELAYIETQIYDLEGSYLEETREFGNIFTGWNSLINDKATRVKKQTHNEDRLFSLSSVTSPATRKEEKKEQVKMNKSKVEGVEMKEEKEREKDTQSDEQKSFKKLKKKHSKRQ